jgi:hypothetical protein
MMTKFLLLLDMFLMRISYFQHYHPDQQKYCLLPPEIIAQPYLDQYERRNSAALTAKVYNEQQISIQLRDAE